MTSLEFIMDMGSEEDTTQIDKNENGSIQTGPSKSRDPSRAATSSHAKPKDQDDKLTLAQTRRRGPSGRSSKSTATASSPSTSSARPASVSRRSTISSESMDPGGYGQSSSSGGGMPPSMPSRPMGNAPGDGSLPVKLTPITRRVSRAKKGVPVHVCDICKPSKTFTRAEHLRRHQLSHGNPRFPCTFPGCDKAFHRADLLARHSLRHDQDDKLSRGTGDDASRPTSAEGPSGMTYIHGPSSMGGVSGSRQGMADPSDMSSSSAYTTTSLSQYQSMSNQGGSSGHTARGESYPTSNPPSGGHSYVLSSLTSNPSPSIGGSPVTGPFEIGFTPRTSPPYSLFLDAATSLSQNLPSLTIPDNNMPPGLVHHGHDGSPWPSSASESNYSTPSEISHRRNNMTRGYESPTSDWPGGLYSGTSHSIHSPGGIDIATTASFFGSPFSPTAPALDHTMTMFPDDASFVEHPQQYTYSSVRSPTPPTISLSAQPAENLVTLATPSIPAVSTGRQKGSQLLGPLGGTTFLTANTLSVHVPRYVDLYWKRFDTLFPLVHRKSSKTAAGEVLRCAMAAVGTQFLQSKEDRIRGNELHELAWKEVKTLYLRFRGRSASRSASEPFQSLYSRVSSHSSPITPAPTFVGSLIYSTFQDHLFSNVPYSPIGQWYPCSTSSSSQMADHQRPDDFLFSTSTTTSTRHDRWNEWIDNESRRRLLAACFVLDVHASVYYQQHLMKPFPMSTTPPIPLIRPTTELWAAQSLESWEALIDSLSSNTEPTTLTSEITAEQVADAPWLDQTVFLASEALRLPKRSSPSLLDLTAEVNETSTERITRLFPGSSVGNTYLALHYTPLHDLLAVSGETWLFTKKVASFQIFQQHKRRLQHWCTTLHAGVAVRFAAKALLAFIDCSNHNTLNATVISNMEEEEGRDGSWHMLDISDYWGLYVCALICWALGHRSMGRGTNAGSDLTSSYNYNHSNANSGEKGEREAVRWLKTVADLSSKKALNMRGRKETMAIVSMVRRRLEDEAVGSKNRLLVDATRTLKNLEERGNVKWF
ncbi:hypothetical protein F5B19DRAFT_501682 [Rostrohypoxylon terebratum]|nr:hypothetical protein F5B19DRAFT_501682 [Rostrohypoxylon terebratum]